MIAMVSAKVKHESIMVLHKTNEFVKSTEHAKMP
jgi:hypothetical protein